MGGFVPRIHRVEDGVWLMQHQHRAFGDGVEIAVGDDDGDFDDVISLRHEAGHFHIDPDEIVLVLRHGGSLLSVECASNAP